MNDYGLINKKAEKIFDELKIVYEYLDFDDDDINYRIKFNTHSTTKILKSLNSIQGILYFNQSDFSMNFIVFNIYTLLDEDAKIDTLDIYEIVNDVNSFLPSGNFLIMENKHIIYRNSLNCGENYNNLSTQALKKQIEIFSDGLLLLFIIIKNKRKNT